MEEKWVKEFYSIEDLMVLLNHAKDMGYEFVALDPCGFNIMVIGADRSKETKCLTWAVAGTAPTYIEDELNIAKE